MGRIRGLGRVAAILALPVLLVLVLFGTRGGVQADADFPVLLEGLRLIQALPPMDASRSGVPVHAFVALVLRLIHAGQPTGQLAEALVNALYSHWLAVTSVLYPMMGAALAVMGYAVFKVTGRLAPVALAQSSPFLSVDILRLGRQLQPESFHIIAVAVLISAVLWVMERERLTDRQAGWLGVVMGFGLACKVSFAPLILVPVFLLDRRRALVVLPLASAAAFLVFVSPALISMPFSLGGYRGFDPDGVIETLWGNPILALILAASILALAGYARLRRRGLIPADPLARLLAAMVLAQMAGLLMRGDLLVLLMLCGPALAVLWVMSARVFPVSGHGRFWGGIAGGMGLVALWVIWILHG